VRTPVSGWKFATCCPKFRCWPNRRCGCHVRQRRGRAAHLPPRSIETSANLKSAWSFALLGFVIGLLAGVIVKHSQRTGVTTRAQLRAALNTLQRMEAVTVGFVLNRVPLAKADPTFRRSPRDMEQNLRNQGDSSSTWPVRWHGTIGEPRKTDYVAGESLSPAQAGPVPPMPSSVKVGQSEPAPPPARHQKADVTLWRTQFASQSHPAPAQVCASSVQPPKLPEWFRERGSGGPGDFARLLAPENEKPAAEQMPSASSRMEGLRGLFENVGLANLHHSHGPFSPDEQPLPTRHAAQSPATMPAQNAAEPTSAAQVEATQDILSPRQFVPIREPRCTSDDATSANLDGEIRILPSKRGQYGS
jgi:hypothetical protein